MKDYKAYNKSDNDGKSTRSLSTGDVGEPENNKGTLSQGSQDSQGIEENQDTEENQEMEDYLTWLCVTGGFTLGKDD